MCLQLHGQLGVKGKPFTPMEEAAYASLRRGHQALRPEVDEADITEGKKKNRTRREARKRKNQADREELKAFRKGSKGGGSKGRGSSQNKGGGSADQVRHRSQMQWRKP